MSTLQVTPPPAEELSVPLVPLDTSDDIAYDLFNSFFSEPEKCLKLAEDLSQEELILRVEVAGRLYWHLHLCINLHLANNQHTGIDREELRARFVNSARARVLLALEAAGEDGNALRDVMEALNRTDDRSTYQISLFTLADQKQLASRIYALVALVAVVRAALEV